MGRVFQIQLRETPYKGGGDGTFGGRFVAGEYEAEQLVGRYRIGNALLVCLVEYGTQHAHIGGDGIVAPAFLQQAFFVSFIIPAVTSLKVRGMSPVKFRKLLMAPEYRLAVP